MKSSTRVLIAAATTLVLLVSYCGSKRLRQHQRSRDVEQAWQSRQASFQKVWSSATPKLADAAFDLEVARARQALKEISDEDPSACLSEVIDLLSVRSQLVRADQGEVLILHDLAVRGVEVGLRCYARGRGAATSLDRAKLVAECERRPHAASTFESEILHASWSLKALYSRTRWIPIFWDRSLREITNPDSLLTGREQIDRYAERAERMSSLQYPKLADELNSLVNEAAIAQKTLAPFGASFVGYNFANAERRETSYVRNFVCLLLVHQAEGAAECERACPDPYSGGPMRHIVDGQGTTWYAVGPNRLDEAGQGDDVGVRGAAAL